MLRRGLPFACALFLFTMAVAPRPAWAIHKSWLMKGTGTSCSFTEPSDVNDQYALGLFNASESPRYVTCPLALSARWGATSPPGELPASLPITRWAGAHAAHIYVTNGQPGTAFGCNARAHLSSGAIAYSRLVTTTAGGDQRLTPATGGDWGGSLETSETQTVRSMDFICSVPGYSGIYGYKVRICQDGPAAGPDCSGTNLDGEQQVKQDVFNQNTVQVSGIECTSNGNPVIERGHFGIRNNSTDSMASVWCPITPAADDTDESEARAIAGTTVHYKGTPFPHETFPYCYLVWRSRPSIFSANTEETWSPQFQHPDFSEEVRLGVPDQVEVGLDVATAVWCELPPGVTLQGIHAKMTVAPVNTAG